jgi:hypothetical protein
MVRILLIGLLGGLLLGFLWWRETPWSQSLSDMLNSDGSGARENEPFQVNAVVWIHSRPAVLDSGRVQHDLVFSYSSQRLIPEEFALVSLGSETEFSLADSVSLNFPSRACGDQAAVSFSQAFPKNVLPRILFDGRLQLASLNNLEGLEILPLLKLKLQSPNDQRVYEVTFQGHRYESEQLFANQDTLQDFLIYNHYTVANQESETGETLSFWPDEKEVRRGIWNHKDENTPADKAARGRWRLEKGQLFTQVESGPEVLTEVSVDQGEDGMRRRRLLWPDGTTWTTVLTDCE